MAVTITKQPQAYMPAFNDQYFEFTSNQTAQDGFFFDVRCEELETGRTQRYLIAAENGTTGAKFNARVFAQAGITSQLNDYDNTEAWRNYNQLGSIRVNIGETYDASPDYYAGTDVDYKVWNGCFRGQDFKNLNHQSWIFNAPTDNTSILSSELQEKVVNDQSTFIHLINRNSDLLESIIIRFRDSNLNSLGTIGIDNPYSGLGYFEDEYLMIDVGPNRLLTYAGGLVSGTPFPTGTVYYDVELFWDNGVTTQLAFKKRYELICEPTFTVYPIHYLARSGSFDTCLFSKQSLKIDSNEKTNVVKYRYSNSSVTNPQVFMDETVLNNLTTERFRLNTFPLSEEELEKYRELVDSSVWYMETASGVFTPVVCEDTNYEVLKRHNRRQRILSATFKLANANSRQSI